MDTISVQTVYGEILDKYIAPYRYQTEKCDRKEITDRRGRTPLNLHNFIASFIIFILFIFVSIFVFIGEFISK